MTLLFISVGIVLALCLFTIFILWSGPSAEIALFSMRIASWPPQLTAPAGTAATGATATGSFAVTGAAVVATGTGWKTQAESRERARASRLMRGR